MNLTSPMLSEIIRTACRSMAVPITEEWLAAAVLKAQAFAKIAPTKEAIIDLIEDEIEIHRKRTPCAPTT